MTENELEGAVLLGRYTYQQRPLTGRGTILVSPASVLVGDDTWSEDEVVVPARMMLDTALSFDAVGAWCRLLVLSNNNWNGGGAYFTMGELLGALGFGDAKYRRVFGELYRSGWATRRERRHEGRYLGIAIVLNGQPQREQVDQ